MTRWLGIGCAAGLLWGLLGVGRALAQLDPLDYKPGDEHRSTGNLRPDARTGAGAIQGSERSIYRRPSSGTRTYYQPYGSYPYGYNPYGYSPYGYNPYGYGAPAYRGYPYYYPPVVVPAGQVYGPAAVQRFMLGR
jgi:hypothetical protein